MRHEITFKNGTTYTIEADWPSEAATKAVKRQYRGLRIRGLRALRVSGLAGMSGMFQSYYPIQHGQALTSYGDNFYVKVLDH